MAKPGIVPGADFKFIQIEQRSNEDHSVLCSAPHSLQVYSTRTCPGDADTRLGAPHLPHLASIRVLPCLIVTDFRSIASLTRRSVSARISSFDIQPFPPVDALVLHAISRLGNKAAAEGANYGADHGKRPKLFFGSGAASRVVRRRGGGLVGIVRRAEAAGAARRFRALFVTGEAAIHAGAIMEIRAPGIILRLGGRGRCAGTGKNDKQ